MQKQKSIDAISPSRFVPSKRLQHRALLKAQSLKRRVIFLDAVVSKKQLHIARPKLEIKTQNAKPVFKRELVDFRKYVEYLKKTVNSENFRKLKFSPLQLAGVCLVVIVAFTGGMMTILNTSKTKADQEPSQSQPAQGQVLGTSTVKVVDSPGQYGPVADVPNEVLFNLTIEQLEGYLAEALKTDEVKEAEKLALRKQKLKEYLEYRKSPFVNIVDTIAELKHWKLVLAISNSESSLGKNCYTNNCSGIGVEPGHPLWREYESTAEWAKDLDKLLEKRYKDWTLEEMNGVYNKPGSANWLAAARQVLEELQERGIE